MKFTQFSPVKLIFGSGSLDQLGFEPLPGKKALLLTSRGTSHMTNGSFGRTDVRFPWEEISQEALEDLRSML